MTVKDLVKLYESVPISEAQQQVGRTKSRAFWNHPLSTVVNTLPHPSPARFITHPHRRDTNGDHSPFRDTIDDVPSTSDSVTNESTLVEEQRLLSLMGGANEETPTTMGIRKGKRVRPARDSRQTESSRRSNVVALNHSPIPATVVFARDAAPLHLPQLDEYLASIPPPPFAPRDGNEEPRMFPPMDALKQSGKSLDDLETNYQKPPAWKNSKSILSGLVNVLLGVLGSSALAPFYSLQGLFNTVQIFALLLSTLVPIGQDNLGDSWRQLFLGTIPDVLALNFASTLVQSLLFLLIFMAIAACLLYRFYRSTKQCNRYEAIEGLQQSDVQGSQWQLIAVTFLLTFIYLPLSTMAVHVLVWSSDLWVVPSPYTNATEFPPILPPLGPPDEFRDPLDFCWTTTMKRNEVNYAPVIIVLSIIVFAFLTIWFPITLRRVIKDSVPKVDKFTELGRRRTEVEMDLEYHRLLSRDRGPFAFLYSGFRRGWGTYESIYLFAKFSTLLIIAVIDPENCVFRTSSHSVLPVVRHVLLMASTIGFFLAQCFLAPFLDPVNNASEWISRMNYVLTSAVALAVTLNIPGKDIFNTYVLYTIYVLTYGFSIYFTVVNWGFMHRFIKRITRRIDFSIDIFSPHLDISSSSQHTKRRIWQESLTTLMLTSTTCQIPPDQKMRFAQSRDTEYPPYLLSFQGTPGERHVENVKILREIGSAAYTTAVMSALGPDHTKRTRIEDIIQKEYLGPDCYWKDPHTMKPGCTNYFGNAWWIPFPQTLVLKYDDGRLAVLQDIEQLEQYVIQNSSRSTQRRRQIRMSLRALDGKLVKWPYEYRKPVGDHGLWCCWRRYTAVQTIRFHRCIMRIDRKGELTWAGVHCGSGFNIVLEYAKNVHASGDAIGLNDDFDLTTPLARFLELNAEIIDRYLPHIEESLSGYRRHHRRECIWKQRVLSYRFLSHVYDRPQRPGELLQHIADWEYDTRIRELMTGSEYILESIYERFEVVGRSEAATWWYIFWDDLWRRNFSSISGLRTYESDFNPHYCTSIAYTPLPRSDLERFLSQRGLWAPVPKWTHFFHNGFLNKLYLRLNEAIFRQSSQAIHFHLGDGEQEYEMDGLDINRGESSLLGTGGGTNHNDSSIRPRPIYRWEGILDDPLIGGSIALRKNVFAKLGAWFGITPLWRAGAPTHGIAVDLQIVNGRYELLPRTN